MLVYAISLILAKKSYIEPGVVLALVVVFGLLMVVLVVVPGLVFRHKERVRALAIAGDTAKMPLARIQPERASADMLTSVPLELR